ncbi:MAG: HD domain-containing phosphohydrolase [Candidatus Zixiibacteriota bacterium]
MTNPGNLRLVVVDDEKYICDIIVESLTAEKYDIISFTDPVKAIEHLHENPVDLVLTDLVMGESSGVEVLEVALKEHQDAIVIIMTAHPTVQTAISVLKKGAYDFLVKPFKLEVLKAVIRRGVAHQKVVRENLTLKGQVEFLKAAGAFTMGIDIDQYLRMVLSSCKTELGAAAAGIIEIDPVQGRIIRTVHESDDEAHTAAVLEDAHLLKFTYTKSPQPHITSSPIKIEDQMMVRTFISSPIFVRRTLHGVINLLVLDRFQRVYPAQLNALNILTNAAASAISNQKLYEDLQTSYLQAIRALANAIEARDSHTAGHTDRVIRLAEPVAREMGWTGARLNSLVMGCTLHDIGKIGVPDSILNKPDRLTDDERQRMINHPLVGLKIVSGIDLFKAAVPYIISHHERYDGKGYPKGLRGDEIPVEGRLLAVVDTFDAILSDRPYRNGASIEIALRELVTNKGKQFDPAIVEVFLQVLREKKINLEELYGRSFDLSCLETIPSKTETVPV